MTSDRDKVAPCNAEEQEHLPFLWPDDGGRVGKVFPLQSLSALSGFFLQDTDTQTLEVTHSVFLSTTH